MQTQNKQEERLLLPQRKAGSEVQLAEARDSARAEAPARQSSITLIRRDRGRSPHTDVFLTLFPNVAEISHHRGPR